MKAVEAAQAAGYVIASQDAWDPAALGPQVQVAQAYWRWCQQHQRPFVLVQTWGAAVVNLVLDTAPLGPASQELDETAILELLRTVSSVGEVAIGSAYHERHPGRFWRARAVPAGQAVAVAQELCQLARGEP
jgi:hypothetical protein